MATTTPPTTTTPPMPTTAPATTTSAATTGPVTTTAAGPTTTSVGPPQTSPEKATAIIADRIRELEDQLQVIENVLTGAGLPPDWEAFLEDEAGFGLGTNAAAGTVDYLPPLTYTNLTLKTTPGTVTTDGRPVAIFLLGASGAPVTEYPQMVGAVRKPYVVAIEIVRSTNASSTGRTHTPPTKSPP